MINSSAKFKVHPMDSLFAKFGKLISVNCIVLALVEEHIHTGSNANVTSKRKCIFKLKSTTDPTRDPTFRT